ncbi:MAG: aminomethyl-transferring glycine dehydrogenase subunit GcvPA [Bacteroidaceae bacterium]|nr:aminomethyl-transferring glycine dehydrogenase subunit GcvPA [Bacteroidaceae bacterium]MBQ6939387.1 aminomethyl-transferring glycine dehydrogenase subunit GcvPA [Muribaculaceae bacterium]
MSFSYFPHTEEDIQAMLARIGMKSLDDLYADIPKDVFFSDDKEYDLPSAYSEEEIRRRFAELESRNRNLTVFAGAGAYDHYAPSVIPYLLQRSEFITAYTPYQAEIAQGTLRYIFEFQSMIASLTGMDCSNASMYDGSTAAAEAVMMALASTRKKTRVLVADTLPVNVRRVIDTYAKYRGINITTLAHVDGVTSLDAVKAELAAGDVAGLLVPAINKYGIIEDFTGFADAMHEQKALFMVYADPSALAVVKTPGEWGADIACGDGQTLGMPMNYGGPYVGFLACKKEHVRKLPGRVVGATRDIDGKRAFVLTLQAREQHIRREKATSNICSNQSLMALYVTIYLALMGPKGLKEVNEMSYGGAHELYNRLIATGKFTPVFDKPFLKEFVLNTTLPVDKLQEALLREGIFGALQTEEGYVSFCVTERRTPEEIDRLINVINTL